MATSGCRDTSALSFSLFRLMLSVCSIFPSPRSVVVCVSGDDSHVSCVMCHVSLSVPLYGEEVWCPCRAMIRFQKRASGRFFFCELVQVGAFQSFQPLPTRSTWSPFAPWCFGRECGGTVVVCKARTYVLISPRRRDPSMCREDGWYACCTAVWI